MDILTRYAELGLAVLVVCGGGLTAAPVPDRFMGDWEGNVVAADGPRPIAAQVIALGKGNYRAKIVGALYQGLKPIATLDGTVQDGKLRFGEVGGIAAGTFNGVLPGAEGGAFKLKHVEKLSPTLGAKPPADAVILLDGKNLNQWRQPGGVYGMADLNKSLGRGQNCVGYLRNAIYSDTERPVRFEIGSDDGVAVWCNGKLVHKANVFRPLTPGQDKAPATLKAGWNDVLMKISQGGGDWAGWLRVVGEDGKPVSGLKVRYAAKAADGTVLGELGARVDGTVLCWQVAGPFREKGVELKELLHTEFPPETDLDSVEWKLIGKVEVPAGPRWKLLGDGAVEVVPHTGSLITRDGFTDFRMHLEFRTPFLPDARGQARGNSGVYLQGRYEIQVLDSYGLAGLDNECGGIYKIARPKVNMCAPPLQWQTYDIEFHAPRFGPDGKKTADARVTVRHNGTVIHKDLDLPHPTGGAMGSVRPGPGPILLQDHHNRVQYRNIWLVPLKG